MFSNVAVQNKDKVEIKPEKSVMLVDAQPSMLCLANYPGNIELNIRL